MKRTIFLGMRPSGQASPDESHIGDADTKCERSEQEWGSGGSPPEKFLRPHPSDRWKMPLFVKKSSLKGGLFFNSKICRMDI